MKEALTFDDVLLVPAASEVVPADVSVTTQLTKTISLNIPIISSAMDTVTGAKMAISMAQNGGIGVIHRNMSIDEQAHAVHKVKRFESGIVENPITIHPEATLGEALDLMRKNKISGIPVVEQERETLVGILTNRDVRFVEDKEALVKELMTHENLVTVKKHVSKEEAKKLFHHHRIEKLLVVDEAQRCVGLITVKDMEKAKLNPQACKDTEGRLRVAAAVGTGDNGFERAVALNDRGVDVVIVDTAHGHSKGVIETVNRIRKQPHFKAEVIAGNVATAAAANALIDAGADGIKVGIGPGSICTTRIIAGVGVPQLTAIMNTVEACAQRDVPLIADGGIKYSGDLAKAIAAGAHSVMIGSLFAGTDEAPGEVVLYQGRSFKSYRGMGSVGAMSKGLNDVGSGSADRYFQAGVTVSDKLVPEGIEGRVPYKGPMHNVLHQLVGGLKASMGYTGNQDIEAMRTSCDFVKITNAGMVESHAHDVHITKEAPNYSKVK